MFTSLAALPRLQAENGRNAIHVLELVNWMTGFHASPLRVVVSGVARRIRRDKDV